MSAALAVQQAVYDALRNDAEMVGALGGTNIYDDVPPAARLPWIVFDRIESEDWSTGTETGEEHEIALTVWSRGDGRRQAQHLASLAVAALCGAGAPLAAPLDHNGHRIINFTHERTLSRSDRDSGHYQSRLVFRAVTEPLSA